MKSTRALILALATILTVWALDAASAATSKLYADWAEGPASLLFTDADRTAWRAITEDVAAERFVRLFWLKRDPSPESAENEFRRDFERRVAMANQTFAETLEGVVTPGWKTDRGRTLILLGPPKRRQKSGSEGEASGGDTGVVSAPGGVSSGGGPGLFGTGGNQDRFGGASEESWVYEDENKPDWLKKKRLTVKFRSEPGKPVVKLHNSEEALAFMAEARTHAIVSPALDESALAGAPAAAGLAEGPRLFGATPLHDEAALSALRAATPGGSAASAGALAAGAFQASDGSWLVPIHVSLPSAPPAGTVAIAELTAEGGASRIAVEFSDGWKSATGQSYAQATLAPAAGAHELKAAIRDASGAIVWSATERVEVPATTDAFWLSEITLSEQIAPMEKAQALLQPYAWQGIAVLPNATHEFKAGGLLWIYLHACQTALDPSGRPLFQAEVEMTGAARFRGPVRGEPVKAGDRCWVVAQAFDLAPEIFPTGRYEVDVRVKSGDAAELVQSTEFKIVP